MIRALLLAAALLPAATQAASNSKRWVHVSIDGTDEERVRVNLPLKLVHSLEPLLDSHDVSDGISINGKRLTREQLKTMLKAVREADEGEYVTVMDDEDQVRVSKEKNRLLVHVSEKNKKEKKGEVKIQVPLAVVEALLSEEGKEEGEELNLAAALEELGRHDSGEIVTVTEEGERIRIWVDGKNESD
ncbi:MAG TPA: hypothetical protein VFR10_05645 [bacterium]|nr:hypothetical protein [bacterium]